MMNHRSVEAMPPPRRNVRRRSDFSEDDEDDDYDGFQSSAESGSGYDEEQPEDEPRIVPEHEARSVQITRLLVIILMIVIAAVVSGGTYVFLKTEQDDDYEAALEFFTGAMKSAIETHAENVFTAMRDCSKMITSDARKHNSHFPFHTVDNIEVMGQWARQQSGMEIFGYAPLVTQAQRAEWTNYSTTHQSDWLDASRQAALESGESTVQSEEYMEGSISPIIYDFGGPNGTVRPAPPPGPFFPLWHISPPPFDPRTVNMNFDWFEFAKTALQVLEQTRRGMLTPILQDRIIASLATVGINQQGHLDYHKSLVDWEGALLSPHLIFVEPVFNETFNPQSDIVGYIAAYFSWDRFVVDLLPEGVEGLVVVIKNTCRQSLTYEIRGARAMYLGRGELHDPKFDQAEADVPFSDPRAPNVTNVTAGQCQYTFHIYSGARFEETYRTNTAKVVTAVAAGSFLVLIIAFLSFDAFVVNQNSEVAKVATTANEIVSSLFPNNVRNRLYEERRDAVDNRPSNARMALLQKAKQQNSSSSRLEQFLSGDLGDLIDDDDENGFMYKSKPIADLYPSATIMFADIAGFTAWSAKREPEQVFTLLETIYKGFDEIAKRRRVYKVETIGDCYVACAGLPEPMKNHPSTMCRFAHSCMDKMRFLTKQLEPKLGEDTGDLDMRFGLHSGPVTAGVLRGERSRFQLFGDTMNTASRMESTGLRGRVQVSQDTADMLTTAGKAHWLIPREDVVLAKGKGEMTTYWVEIASSDLAPSSHSISYSDADSDDLSDRGLGTITEEPNTTNQFNQTHLDWHVDNAVQVIQEIRVSEHDPSASFFEGGGLPEDGLSSGMIDLVADERPDERGDAVWELDEIVPFQATTRSRGRAQSGTVHETVKWELEQYIRVVMSMHRRHKFHNFTQSTEVAQRLAQFFSGLDPAVPAAALILGDPLIRLAGFLACIFHNADHPGADNSVVVKENVSLANLNKYGAAIEQNAFDLGWELLMEDEYENLRNAICRGKDEKKRFRRTLYHCVMSTNLTNQALLERHARLWEEAFGDSQAERSPLHLDDLRATLALECMISASVSGYACQDWEEYRRWNCRICEENYTAFVGGRMDDDPSDKWYEDEVLLFEKEVIPRNQRLLHSNVVSGAVLGPLVTSAQRNLQMWKNAGPGIVSEIMTDIASGAT